MTGEKVYVIVTKDPSIAGGKGATKTPASKKGETKNEAERQAKEKAREIRKSISKGFSLGGIVLHDIVESNIAFQANNAGYLTGDFISQRDQQRNYKILQTGLSSAFSFASIAISTGNIAGAATSVAFGLAERAVSSTVSYLQNEEMLEKMVSKANADADFFRERSGLDPSTNNSR